MTLEKFLKTTVRTILNRQRWNAGFSIITEANTNGGIRVSASVSKNVRSIEIQEMTNKIQDIMNRSEGQKRIGQHSLDLLHLHLVAYTKTTSGKMKEIKLIFRLLAEIS